MKKLTSLYQIRESRPTMYDGQLDGSEKDAERLLRQAVSSGKPIPSATKRSYMVWRVGDNFIGASFHEGGWVLVWTVPVNTQRVSVSGKTGVVGRTQDVGMLDPHGDEIDDYAITVNWVDPTIASQILQDDSN